MVSTWIVWTTIARFSSAREDDTISTVVEQRVLMCMQECSRCLLCQPAWSLQPMGFAESSHLHLLLCLGVIKGAPDEALCGKDCVGGVGDGLPLGRQPHQPLPLVREGHHRGRCARPLRVLDHLGCLWSTPMRWSAGCLLRVRLGVHACVCEGAAEFL